MMNLESNYSDSLVTGVMALQGRSWVEIGSDYAAMVGALVSAIVLIVALYSLSQWKKQERTKHYYQAALDLRIAAVEFEGAIRMVWIQCATALALERAEKDGRITNVYSNNPMKIVSEHLTHTSMSYTRAVAIAEIYFKDQIATAITVMSKELADVLVAQNFILNALAGNHPDQDRVVEFVERAVGIMVGRESLTAAKEFDKVLLTKIEDYYGIDN